MSGDDGRSSADEPAPGDDRENPSDDTPSSTDGSDRDGDDGGGGRPTDDRRATDEQGGAASESGDGVPNGGRPGEDDAGAVPTADPDPPVTRVRHPDDRDGLLDRFLHADGGPLLFAREVASSVGAVVIVGLILFAVSGVWPPMVAVESGSMEPHMTRGDLVFITEEGRFMPDDATFRDTGVVTASHGREVGYRTFGGYGSVVVYDSPERFGPPIIHRARFWVERGENWYDEANKQYINADSCAELANCPAPHAGFITKGDANPSYDQAMGISEPVKPGWINGVARVKVPYLGWIRLLFSEEFATVLHTPGPAATVQTGPTVRTPPPAVPNAGVRA